MTRASTTPGLEAKHSLRKQFVSRILIISVIIALISGLVQGWLLYNQMRDDIERQASLIGQTVKQGIDETDLASKEIEGQIDLKLASYTDRIAERLGSRKAEDVTNEELRQLQKELGLAGISLFVDTGDDLVGLRASDEKEIGFSWKKVGEKAYGPFLAFVRDQDPGVEGQVSFIGTNLFIMYTAQSGSHDDKPTFFKYAYYHRPHSNYMISAYIEASEVYTFTTKVGPDSLIENVLKQQRAAKEIAVLDPRVFADPKLEKELYPPLKRVVHGHYQFGSAKDEELLRGMASQAESTRYVEKVGGETLYKMFLPMDEGRVIYIALDYRALSASLTKFSITVIIFGLISLAFLFLFTASFFTKIYRNMQRIIAQIRSLEAGDFTVRSDVRDGGDLQSLSETTNKMVHALNRVLTESNVQAANVRRLSVMLEREANESVDKVFQMSMETTAGARETVEEFYEFLDRLTGYLRTQPESAAAGELLAKVDKMRSIAEDRTKHTTDMTITLSDLMRSLYGQSRELSGIADLLLKRLIQFKL